MTPQGKKLAIAGGIFGGMILIGGIWYLVSENNKKNAPCPGNNMHKDANGNCVLNAPETPAPPVVTTPPPVNTSSNMPSNILEFQKFANNNGWTPALVLDNQWGPKTAAAWAALKAQYLKPANSVATPPVSPIKKLTGFTIGENLYANDNNKITNAYKSTSVGASNIYKSYSPNYFIGTYVGMDSGLISLAAPETGFFGTSYKQVYVLQGDVYATK